jgi:DNA adenine methylase
MTRARQAKGEVDLFGNQDLRTPAPFQWCGGKSEMMHWLEPLFPAHHTFVDLCGGSAAVTLLKRPSPVEVYNDLDGELVNFYRVCREKPEALATLLLFTPYARAEYDGARETLVQGDDLERARKWAVVARQSMAGAWGRSWSAVVTHSRRGMASGCSRWLHMPEDVLAVPARLAQVQIENLEAGECLAKYDHPEMLAYIDPPYLADTRAANLYRVEMAAEGHVKLLLLLNGAQGKLVLSGYEHSLYHDLLPGWRVERTLVKCRSNVNSKGGTSARPMREEVVWIKDRPGLYPSPDLGRLRASNPVLAHLFI